MRLLPLLLLTALTVSLSAQTSGRHYRRDPRTPETAAASKVVEATAHASLPPLKKLRSGRPWPSYHFGRLPTDTGAPAAGPVDASHSTPVAKKRGFWRPRG